MDFSSPSSRWTALTTRNRLADAHFFYAVKTTKIYCRPSCAARLARRANVEFYNTPAAATKAGFRACKRCKPDRDPQDNPQDVAVARACYIIRATLSSTDHANGHIGLNELAERVQLTPSYLHKTFKAKMGMTPKKYAESLRQPQASAVTTFSEPVLAPDAMTYDAYSSFVNDLTGSEIALGGMHGTDTVIDIVGLTCGGFSDTTTSTPMAADWSWLDTLNPEFEACEFFDADVLAQKMQCQDQVGWNDRSHQMSGKDWETLPDTAARQNVFDTNGDVGAMSY